MPRHDPEPLRVDLVNAYRLAQARWQHDELTGQFMESRNQRVRYHDNFRRSHDRLLEDLLACRQESGHAGVSFVTREEYNVPSHFEYTYVRPPENNWSRLL
jgi:hypothetical protein